MNTSPSDIKIERHEITFVLLWTTIILSVSSIPYIYGYMATPADKEFMGLIYYIDDQNPYLSWMRQAVEGKIFFQNMYTSENHQPHLLFVYFLILGFIAKYFTLPLISVYHGARVVSAVLLLFALYYLISALLKDKNERKTAFLLAAIGSGFGWFFMIIGSVFNFYYLTTDMWVPDAILFTSIMMSPLYACAIFLLLLTFAMLFKWYISERLVYLILAGISCFVLALVHPYDVFTVYAMFFAFLTVSYIKHRKSFYKKLNAYLILLSLSITPMIYNFYIVLTDPVLKGWKEQISEPTGSPVSVIFGFGIIFLLALYGFKKIIGDHEKDDSNLFLIAWIVTSLILIFTPSQIQRRLLLGFQVPLSILAAIAFYRYLLPLIVNMMKTQEWEKKIQKWATLFLLLSVIPTNFFIIGRTMKQQTVEAAGYLKKDEINALKWLEKNSVSDDVVLADYILANYIPRLSGNRVYMGYHQLTLNQRRKVSLVNEFFKETTEIEKKKGFLKENRIAYIYYGEREKKLGEYEYVEGDEPRHMVYSGDSKVDLYKEDYLKVVFQNSGVTIFKVINSHS